jgi:SAM-dependent methyltransferase
MDVPTVLLLDEPETDPSALDATTLGWLRDAVGRCDQVIDLTGGRSGWPEQWKAVEAHGIAEAMTLVASAIQANSPPAYRFDYSTYEFCQRDHPLLVAMQTPDVAHFAGCETVLDLGCGAGIFLDCLRKQGISGRGVERDPRIAEYGRGMGLDIITDDALHFLARDSGQFDGIYCSHFVEHLPFEMLQGLFEGLAERLRPGGVLVLVFPDPESIRSQLLGFWRDPEHVRFYHPELVTALAHSVGLELDWSSHQAQPHKVVSFPEQPHPLAPFERPPSPVPLHSEPAGLVEKLLYRLGFVHRRQFERLESAVQSSLEALQQSSQLQGRAVTTLRERTDTLWDVNLTWAWSDNATMRFKKRASYVGGQA